MRAFPTHLKRLSEITSNQGLRLLSPAMSPGSHCPMHTALSLSDQIRDLSTLVVGTPECGNYSHVVLESPVGARGELHWSYVLSADETVFGCREGLISALREMDHAGAKAILILLTCVPELIGEDLDAIVFELQPTLHAQLVPVSLAHFKCVSFPSGFSKTLLGLGGLMQRRPVSEDRVNLLGFSGRGEEHEFLRHLRASGLCVCHLGAGASVEDFVNAPDAAYNLVCSPFAAPLAAYMQEKWKTPALPLHSLYGTHALAAPMQAWTKRMRLPWANHLESWQESLRRQENPVRAQLAGLTLAMASKMLDPVPLAAYLASLGMRPVFLHVEEFYQEDIGHAQRLLASGADPWVCHRDWNAETIGLPISKPEVILGSLGASGGTICVPQLDQLDGLLGYERSIRLLQWLSNAVSEREASIHGAS